MIHDECYAEGERVKILYRSIQDTDAQETNEWLEAFKQVVEHGGQARGSLLLEKMQYMLRQYQFQEVPVDLTPVLHSNRIIPCPVPDDIMAHERQAYRGWLKWNAIAMVIRTQRIHPELGGHIATVVSIADIYDIGYEYFFQGAHEGRLADCVFFQGHSSPIIYARSYIEGLFGEEHLDHFRREVKGQGLPSYPHPYLMPTYWQFPTVSMGLGILQGIHLGRVLKYLDQRKLLPLGDRRVWIYAGDGEMHEPESISGLLTASVNRLAHVTMVINANLQGLDGLCRGNGSVIRELEGLFEGAGWRVIKVVWNQAWLDLFASEPSGVFADFMASWLDGDHQNFYHHGVEYLASELSRVHPELMPWFETQKDNLQDVLPGGHDHALLYQAYHEAVAYTGGPSVIIAQTIKGHGLKMSSQNFAHQNKKVSPDDLIACGAMWHIPLSHDELADATYYRPEGYKALRRSLTPIPERTVSEDILPVPQVEDMLKALGTTGTLSTTSSFVRVLSFLLRDATLAPRIIPIVADEARTFGMEGLFKNLGVYQSTGAQFISHDLASLTGYRDSSDGQLLQEGINEAGAMATWMACATSYSVNHLPLVPFYIFYSMFGFQRTMDMIWAAADSRARGFLLGATSGRTTLAGEGLQHADGHSLVLAAMVPSVVWYDPAWHDEVVVIMQYWLDQMLCKHRDVIVYMTLINEVIAQQSLSTDHVPDIIRGMYRYSYHIPHSPSGVVHLLGSGALFHEMHKVYTILQDCGVAVALYSVTSYGELRRSLAEHPDDSTNPVCRYLSDASDVVVAVSDYVSLVPDMIRAYVKGEYIVCGTDGFGMSDTRAALREHFGVDALSIMEVTLASMMKRRMITQEQRDMCMAACLRGKV